MSQYNDARFTNLEEIGPHISNFIAKELIYEGDVVTLANGSSIQTLGVSQTTLTTDIVIGVALDNAVTNTAVPVQAKGPIVKVVANGTINYGNYVGPTTTAGRVVAVTASGNAQQILGQALCRSAASAGDIISVLLTGGIVRT